MQFFPFDTQTCALKFGSWSYTKDLLNLLITGPTNNITGKVIRQFYQNSKKYRLSLSEVYVALWIRTRNLWVTFEIKQNVTKRV
jgi:hypothetical protein